MTLMQYDGKKVRIESCDGVILEGFVVAYMYPEDNEPEQIESLIVEPYPGQPFAGQCLEYYERDIKNIRIIR